MKQIPAPLLSLIVGILITLISLWVGQNHNLMPVQASEQAPLVDNFFNTMVTIATALFLIVQGAILLFAIKYRKRPGDETDGVPIEGNFNLEILWTVIPALIVIGLSILSVEVYQQMGGFSVGGTMMAHNHSATLVAQMSDDANPVTRKTSPTYGLTGTDQTEAKAPSMVINVTGMQYAWIFNYPESGIVSGELHIPVGKDVQINLAAQDVIHSFWIPQFRLKQDVLPGEKSTLRFVATKTGTFPIVCAELCGSYHGSMRTQAIVHTPKEFEQWLAENSATA
ncbi:MAG: cytochrome c oxidase subunit II [Stigonema ocellatum SAG 48.90 = DSM 106950]|nr:cytochrome c oxidase subunit II [Stigonema ocellatum SAG 48.90 = DSM 106950]